MKESLKSAHTVCRGCFHASSSLAGAFALKHGINVVVGATLSPGQIIENKLLIPLAQGITEVARLEEEIDRITRSAPQIDPTTFQLLGIDEIMDGSVYNRVTFIDFYRYCDITNAEMNDFLSRRSPHWDRYTPHAVYSTNCPLKQLGDYHHLQEKGFHYYGGATSWEVRLGHIESGDIRNDLSCGVSEKGHENFLKKIGVQPASTLKKNEDYICGYIVPERTNGSNPLNESELRQYLLKRLPNYMIPSYFVQLDSIPLTLSGKINQKALPAPQVTRANQGATYVSPKTDLEKQISDIWREALKVDRAGIQDNFFDLGGSSLDLIIISSKLKELMKRDVPLVDLFSYPTIEALANHLNSDSKAPPQYNQDRAQEREIGKDRLKRRLKRKMQLEKTI
jgi:acyl carrier protein